MTEEEKQAIALFKYSLIAPLVAGRSRKLPASAIDKIYEYRQQMPYITVKKIYSKLIEEGYLNKKDSSIDAVYRYMRNNSELKNSIPVNECLSFEFEHVGDCWQADSSHGPTITVDGKKITTWLISFQDDASEIIVHGEFFENDNANNVQLCFKKAIAKSGKPKRIYLDNGGSYANQQLDLICAELGIHLIHTKPYHPTSHGKIEKSHRTMKDGWMNANDWNQWSTLKELNESYQDFLAQEYTNEIHSSLGISPKERYLKDIREIKFIEKEQLEAAFLNRTTRKVTATATVSIFNIDYEVPQQFIRKKIELRYNPFDTTRLFVYQEGKLCRSKK